MTIGLKTYCVTVDTDEVAINFPDSESPYVPEYIVVNKKEIIIGVFGEDRVCREKKIEWRDALIMHKALTRIFGRRPKKKKKV